MIFEIVQKCTQNNLSFCAEAEQKIQGIKPGQHMRFNLNLDGRILKEIAAPVVAVPSQTPPTDIHVPAIATETLDLKPSTESKRTKKNEDTGVAEKALASGEFLPTTTGGNEFLPITKGGISDVAAAAASAAPKAIAALPAPEEQNATADTEQADDFEDSVERNVGWGEEDLERCVEEKEVTEAKKGETKAEKLIREGEEEIAEMAKAMEAKMLKLEIFKKARYEEENPAPQTPAPTDTPATAIAQNRAPTTTDPSNQDGRVNLDPKPSTKRTNIPASATQS